MTTNKKIETLCDAIEILAKRLYNVAGGETYYAVCEKLNAVVEAIQAENENEKAENGK